MREICAINVNKGEEQKLCLTAKGWRNCLERAPGGKANVHKIGPLETAEDDETVFKKGCGIIMVQNTIRGGKDLHLAPYAKINDGFMDCVYADKLSSGATLGIFNKVFNEDVI